jgi:hypothetical protein
MRPRNVGVGAALLCRLSYNLAELDLSNNTGVTGLLPAQLGLLPQLQVVKMLQTNLSCAGITKPYVSAGFCTAVSGVGQFGSCM